MKASGTERSAISFAYRPYHAVSVPWTAGYLPTLRRRLASRGVQVGWNVDSFDVPLVRRAGVEVNGEVHELDVGLPLLAERSPKGAGVRH